MNERSGKLATPVFSRHGVVRFRGARALSEFRREKLIADLREHVESVAAIDAEYWHFVSSAGELTQSQLDVLTHLLTYGPRHQPVRPMGDLFLVVPRIGTISPWSTKATDIAHLCGLDTITRIERGVAWYVALNGNADAPDAQWEQLAAHLHDPMTESVLPDFDRSDKLFEGSEPPCLSTVDVLKSGAAGLARANTELGLALSDDEIKYLTGEFTQLGRDPTDVELMMFAQVNSEHCRHKIFNADWIVDGERQPLSLFDMIRETHRANHRGTLVAYADNAAILEGSQVPRFFANPKSREYGFVEEPVHIVCKVETHNHPTAISPFPGAATGSGGEIRDEGATGRGAKPKAGITGFSVSHLRLPGARRPWEDDECAPSRIASPLQIMLEGPIGGASFNNEFGRPNISGYFRTFEQWIPVPGGRERRGYHKPIMLAGGVGNIRSGHVHKQEIPELAHVIVLGGPAMLIGLGGGAASSVATGTSSEQLDFASVQRSNAEMQRRCQEVIDQCWSMGDDNPIISIHDIGAGGLSNAVPELVHASDRGGHFQLRDVLNDDPGMTPMQIWCNEAQERYVIAVAAERLGEFESICEREKCLYCVIGRATKKQKLLLEDRHFAAHGAQDATPINMDMHLLFGNPPKMLRDVSRTSATLPPFDTETVQLEEAVDRVLRFPAIADKTFLVTIGDRSVTGLVCRDQMVGPWQVPVADVAVTAASYASLAGEAVAIGERTPLAIIDPAASGRMAIAEALTNLAAARIRNLEEVKLSANWMAAAGHPGDDAALFDTVRAVGMELCQALGVAVPVGKDSLSMKTVWSDENGERNEVTAPVSLIVSAFAPVSDVRATLTPVLTNGNEPTELLLIDLGNGNNRMGGCALAQVYGQLGNVCPDVDDARQLRRLLLALQSLNAAGLLLAYHDRSDGGLWTTLCEMAFAGRVGLRITLDGLAGDPAAILFNEELGVVCQTRVKDHTRVRGILAEFGLNDLCHNVGKPIAEPVIRVERNGEPLFAGSRVDLHRAWSETTWRLQSMRDHPLCAQQEYDRIRDIADPGLHAELTFKADEDICRPFNHAGEGPRVAILREQGVNGHIEMAAAFHNAGFTALDVTMSDLVGGVMSLDHFQGLVACGGFSFGDVLGAGEGWAKSVLFNFALRDQFQAFFHRADTFTLGVCNGCQMLSNLHELIPGADHWPRFVRNLSEQFEARWVMVEVMDSPSILLTQMRGSRIPVVVAHGEGRAEFTSDGQQSRAAGNGLVVLRFVDNRGEATVSYPYNPNGSPDGVTGLTSTDGRVTIMMPHPERVFRTVGNTWEPPLKGEYGPWMRLFRNARAWIG